MTPTPTPEDIMLRTERRAAVTRAVNLRSPVRTRRRKANEVPAPRVAITSHCSECLGFAGNGAPGTMLQQIRECTARECWLWPWRAGSLDPALVRGADPETGRQPG